MILTDFIKLTPVSEPKIPDSAVDFEGSSVEDTVELFQQLNQHLYVHDFASYGEREILQGIRKRAWDAMNKRRIAILKKFGGLPKKLISKDDPLSLAASFPRINLSEIRQVADRLGFVVIPYEYFNSNGLPKGWNNDSPMKNFYNGMNTWCDVYVLCPVDYYDVEKHIESEQDRPIYAGRASQAFMAINISLPMFRSLHREMKKIKKDVRFLEDRFDNLTREVKELHNRVEELSRMAEQQQVELLRQKAESEALQRRLEELEASEQNAIALDPLMFAVPKETSIVKNNELAFTGPCWGEDFEDIVCELLNLKQIAGQRKKHSEYQHSWSLLTPSKN